MSTVVTLDYIREAAEARYGSLDITGIPHGEGTLTARLINPLRLPKLKRDALIALQDALEEDDADQEALLAEAIRLVAENPTQADALLRVIGEDLALLASIFEDYSKGTQMGEASPSAD